MSCARTLCVVFLTAAVAHAASVTGVIVDAFGGPIPSIALTVRDSDDRLVLESSSREDGSFDLGELPPGRFSIEAWATGFDRDRRSIVLGRADLRLTIGMRVGANHLIQWYPLRGMVRDENRDAVPGARITLRAVDNSRVSGVTTSNAEGSFRLQTSEVGWYELHAVGPEREGIVLLYVEPLASGASPPKNIVVEIVTDMVRNRAVQTVDDATVEIEQR